jgi:phosphatidylinositol alpha 1,6-mannosyltransferase
MRVAIVTESFLPQVNGVTTSVLRLAEHLRRCGHPALIVAPGAGPTRWAGADVVRVPSAPVPGYASHRVAWPWPWLTATLREFGPDLVHAASPTVLGAQGVLAADRLGVASIAVYQTDLAAYASLYRAGVASRAVWRWLRWVHGRAGLTLAPSRDAVARLEAHGVPRVRWWPRGVDLDRFYPGRRDLRLRAELAGGAELLVGYVGRLAAEKQVHLLSGLADRSGAAGRREVRLVVVGDGPLRAGLERDLPDARFPGFLDGDRLAEVYASLDVFVHTGPHETFCQAAQEALASGVPVVAPAAGGLLDLVSDGVTGHLYPPGSAAALVAAVDALAASPAARARMGAAARQSVLGRSWTTIGDQYLQHAQHLLTPWTGERTA